jgi:hypothetical protein
MSTVKLQCKICEEICNVDQESNLRPAEYEARILKGEKKYSSPAPQIIRVTLKLNSMV